MLYMVKYGAGWPLKVVLCVTCMFHWQSERRLCRFHLEPALCMCVCVWLRKQWKGRERVSEELLWMDCRPNPGLALIGPTLSQWDASTLQLHSWKGNVEGDICKAVCVCMCVRVFPSVVIVSHFMCSSQQSCLVFNEKTSRCPGLLKRKLKLRYTCYTVKIMY